MCIDVILENYNHEMFKLRLLRHEILILSFLNPYFILDGMAITIEDGDHQPHLIDYLPCYPLTDSNLRSICILQNPFSLRSIPSK